MKKYLELNYHSFVDVITNSSTEVFVSASGDFIGRFKELVTEVLKMCGMDDIDLDTYLEFVVFRYDDSFEDYVSDNQEVIESFCKDLGLDVMKYNEKDFDLVEEYEKRAKEGKSIKVYNEAFNKWAKGYDYDNNGNDFSSESKIYIISKKDDSQTLEIMGKVSNLIHTEVMYNG